MCLCALNHWDIFHIICEFIFIGAINLLPYLIVVFTFHCINLWIKEGGICVPILSIKHYWEFVVSEFKRSR